MGEVTRRKCGSGRTVGFEHISVQKGEKVMKMKAVRMGPILTTTYTCRCDSAPPSPAGWSLRQPHRNSSSEKVPGGTCCLHPL